MLSTIQVTHISEILDTSNKKQPSLNENWTEGSEPPNKAEVEKCWFSIRS